MAYLFLFLAKLTKILHICISIINIISVPLLIINMPIYVWLPIITILFSPLLTGSHCVLNRAEDYFKAKSEDI